MWMSDKPLVQEELSEELGSLIHCFPDIKVSIQFYQNFLETMCLEWFGIDQWRIDKFMMVSESIYKITISYDLEYEYLCYSLHLEKNHFFLSLFKYIVKI